MKLIIFIEKYFYSFTIRYFGLHNTQISLVIYNFQVQVLYNIFFTLASVLVLHPRAFTEFSHLCTLKP
jgi:hypothetical protein